MKIIPKVNRRSLSEFVSDESLKNLNAGFDKLASSVKDVKAAGEAFAKIPDREWNHIKREIPGEIRRWADNCRRVELDGLNPAFAMLSSTFGRKARKLPKNDQDLILVEPVEVAILDEAGRLKDKKMVMASELRGHELDRVIPENGSSAKIASPKEQAAAFRQGLKALEMKKKAQTSFTIEKPGYVVSGEGVQLKRKTISLSQFPQLIEDVKKVREELGG